MNAEISRMNTDRSLFEICPVDCPSDSPGTDSSFQGSYVLANYHFKIPLVHLKFLDEVFGQIERQLKKDSGKKEDLPWQTFWLSQVFAIRVMQYHDIHKSQRRYALNNTYRLYLNSLFIKSVCWYMEEYSVFPRALPGKSRQYFEFVYWEASILLDNNFSYISLLDGKEKINNLFSGMGRQSSEMAEWDQFRDLAVEFASICIETIVSADKTEKLPNMDPESMETGYSRQMRQQSGESSSPVLSEYLATPEMAVNGN